ncbi:hypothetical protein AZI85_00025 [Bdellovibrio bacteriovorus]|uniref:DUF1622 domain-containing protein n=1 Tax=Bdellovibrio bacteriovorus TaxID=959 RepID=A0A150WV99_BDEBC|nr:DUF1622 domain-containing protein [Bdellovibrio bacteriovorus]KYG70383.1 hypothetical protein AZI85_00025 [Bdellovibrio bacteriovorus]
MVHENIQQVAVAFELAGIGTIIIGALYATAKYTKNYFSKDPQAYRHYRSGLGNAILLGLELLVAGDIIGTVAVEPTYQNVGVLGLIVLIRTFLSWSLSVEIHGRWPWQETDSEPKD